MLHGGDGGIQPYKYNGKELDRMHGLEWYDYGARMYNGYRFTTPDPLSERYYSTSPYAYCENDPVNRIDPSGMIWDDVKDAERLKKSIDNRIASLNKSINKYQLRIENGGLSERKLAGLEAKLSEARERVGNLEQSKRDIDLLGNDPDNVYAFNRTNGGIHQVWKGEDGKVYIDTSSEAMSIHEITHVKQSLESGGLKFSEGGKLLNAGSRLSPREGRYEVISQMEVDAYRMQYSFDRSFPGYARSLNDINVHSVGNIGNGMIYEAIRKYSKYLELKELLSE